MIKIESATTRHIPEVQQIFEQAIKVTAPAHYSSKQMDIWLQRGNNPERWSAKIEKDYFIIVGSLQSQSSLVGFASLQANGYIDVIYVHPGFLRQGIASFLLQKLEEKANHLALPTLTVDSSLIAIPFFLKREYQVVTASPKEIGGATFPNTLMQKILVS
jgi:putative acetyltransferase